MRRLAVSMAVLVAVLAVGDERSAAQQAKAKAAAPALRFVQPVVPDEDALVKQVEQQYAGQFRQLFKSELHFMRVVAEPTRAQFDTIAADAEAGRKAAIRAFALSMRGVAKSDDPRKPLTDAIAKSVHANLSPDQSARYRKELDAREAARKHLFVTNLVAMIDRHVILRPDQREKLARVLADNWDDSWQLQILMYGGQYLPSLPDAKITPILSEAQRQVWRGVSKNNVRFGVNLGFVQGIEMEDEVWDGEPSKKQSGGTERNNGPRSADKPEPPQ